MLFLLGRWTIDVRRDDEVASWMPYLVFLRTPYRTWDDALFAAQARDASARWVIIGVADVTLAERALTSGQPIFQDEAQNCFAMPGPLFGATASPPRPLLFASRVGHTATRLHDGRVLIAGGSGIPADLLPGMAEQRHARGVLLAQAELFDPYTETWSLTGCLAAPRSGHRAVLLADGRVLVSGGQRGRGWLAAEAEIFDPGTGKWSAAGALQTPRELHQVALLSDGRVLAAGGYRPNPRWDYSAPPTFPERYAGGWDFVSLAEAELFDPVVGTWTVTAPMRERRWWRAPEQAHTLAGGCAAVVGGAFPSGLNLAQRTEFADVEIFDPARAEWTSTSPRDLPGWGVVETPDGSDRRVTYINIAWSAAQPDGRLLVFARRIGMRWRPDGTGQILPATAQTALFDPPSGFWRTVPSMSGPGAGTAEGVRVALADGRILALNGGGRMSAAPGAAEIFSRETGTWARTGDVIVPQRMASTATLLADGVVLLAGGKGAGQLLAGSPLTTELFDPGSAVWRASGQANASASTAP